MDKILDKFSLQTFLRQFFCGVVFFVPIWLFGGASVCNFVNLSQWGVGAFGLFIALSCIVGTIIYHLEKNMYSYFTNYLFFLWSKKKNWRVCLSRVMFILILICFVYGAYRLFEGASWAEWILVLLGIWCFLAVIYFKYGNDFREEVREFWLWEDLDEETYERFGSKDKKNINHDEICRIKAAAKKIAR